MMPIDFPPPEIIEALEEQLDMDFIHFTVTLEGVVEGVFGNGLENQIVSFEAKREMLSSFQIPPIENLIAELDDKAVEDMKKMFQSILAEIENMSEKESVELGGHTPLFDEDWYCP
tara:strand:+ start:531 stop:878 length:348 start_codon:yes stop_codon:yes gene_type:complete